MGTHHEKLELKGMQCASQVSIPNTAGMSPDSAGDYTDMRSSKPKQASHTPDISYLLVSSMLFPSSSPISVSRPQLQHLRRTHSQVMSLYLSMP